MNDNENDKQNKKSEKSERGEAFFASLVIMIIEGIAVNFFVVPLAALSIFDALDGTAGDGMMLLISAAGKLSLFTPPIVILINLGVMLSDGGNEENMKKLNRFFYIAYPIFCLGGVGIYYLFR